MSSFTHRTRSSKRQYPIVVGRTVRCADHVDRLASGPGTQPRDRPVEWSLAGWQPGFLRQSGQVAAPPYRQASPSGYRWATCTSAASVLMNCAVSPVYGRCTGVHGSLSMPAVTMHRPWVRTAVRSRRSTSTAVASSPLVEAHCDVPSCWPPGCPAGQCRSYVGQKGRDARQPPTQPTTITSAGRPGAPPRRASVVINGHANIAASATYSASYADRFLRNDQATG